MTPSWRYLAMSEVIASDELEDLVDDQIDEEDDDAIEYPEPDEVGFDAVPDQEGDDTVHAITNGGAA
jgi:hypothetical protein